MHRHRHRPWLSHWIGVLLIVVGQFIFAHAQASVFKNSQTIDTLFGPLEIDHPLIEQLLHIPAMKRLESVDQSGTPRYFSNLPAYSRYSHSVGVYALLKRYKAPFEEQVAGLLHDSSHTVFSHLADVLFKSKNESYQDSIHTWYLTQMGVEPIVKKHGLSLKTIDPKRKDFLALSREIPDLSADRIEYNLHTALLFKLITAEDIQKILADLKFLKGQWYFTHKESAKKLAKISLYLTEHFWGSASNIAVYHWSAEMMKRALALKLITMDDIHFGTDKQVLDKLNASGDEQIQKLIHYSRHDKKYFEVVKGDKFDLHFKPKFRGLDPYILSKGRLLRLTRMDSHYRKEYDRVKNKMANGIKLKFKTDKTAGLKKTKTIAGVQK